MQKHNDGRHCVLVRKVGEGGLYMDKHGDGRHIVVVRKVGEARLYMNKHDGGRHIVLVCSVGVQCVKGVVYRKQRAKEN